MKNKLLKQVSEKIFLGAPLYSIMKLPKSKTGIPLINIKDIIEDNIQTEGITRFDCKQFRNSERYVVVPGDIIIACRGTQLKIAVVPNYFNKALITSNLIAMRLKNDVLPLYLATYLRSAQGQKKLLSQIYSSGISIMLKISDLEEIKSPVPQLLLQKKISVLANTAERYYRSSIESANLCKRITAQLINDIFDKEVSHV